MKTAPAVTVDARWLAGGVGTYAFNVVRELHCLNTDLNLQVLTTEAGAENFAALCDDVKVLNAPVFSTREQIELASVAPDRLLHCTHYNAPLLRRGPLVVTVPDVTPLIEGTYHSSRKSRFFGAFALRTVARRADHIITVSEYSRAQIAEKLRIPQGKISVAYNGVNDAFRPMELELARAICTQRLGMQEPFLLYVGNLRSHKNVGTLLRAYKLCRLLYRTEQHLVVIGAGRPQATTTLHCLAAELGIANRVHFVSSVDEATLVAAYNASDAVVIPSLEEGFCLPVVEAMACGTPVACSDTSALPEIAGDAAAYFDPRNASNMADIIQTVLEKGDLRQYMRARGLGRAARFKWTESAQIHLGVYSQFLDSCPAFGWCNQTARSGSEKVPLAHVVPTTRV